MLFSSCSKNLHYYPNMESLKTIFKICPEHKMVAKRGNPGKIKSWKLLSCSQSPFRILKISLYIFMMKNIAFRRRKSVNFLHFKVTFLTVFY